MATYQELRTRSQQVRDEQNIGGNTALRVGQLLMDIVKYFNDNDAAASEYLQQHFAMVNDGTQLLNWQQSPIVILHTMGDDYDDGDFSALSQGENYYRNGFIVEANGQGGGINGETPKANVLYVNLANDTLYTWNGSSFDAITSGGGGGSILNVKDNNVYNVWVGTEAELEALDGDYEDNTIYLVGVEPTVAQRFNVTFNGGSHTSIPANTPQTVKEGSAFSVIVSPASGYTIDTATGTMVGGTLAKTNNQDGTVTFSTTSVTGAISIQAAATKHITGIMVSAGTRAGNSIPLTAAVAPPGAENVNLAWSVNDTTNFGISGSGASATLTVKSGASNASVTITCQDTNAASGTASGTLRLTGITYDNTVPITALGNVSYAAGSAVNTYQFSVEVTPSGGNTPAIVWSVAASPANAASIDSGTGLLTITADCSVVVTATAGQLSSSSSSIALTHAVDPNAHIVWEDANMEAFMLGKVTHANPNYITINEAASYTDNTFYSPESAGIYPFNDIKGVVTKFNEWQYFTGLTKINLSNFTALTEVTMPSTVLIEAVLVGTRSGTLFAGTLIQDVEIPSGVTSFDGKSFDSCAELENIIFPSTLTTLVAFPDNCPKLRTIDLSNTSLGAYTLHHAKTNAEIIKLPPSLATMQQSSGSALQLTRYMPNIRYIEFGTAQGGSQISAINVGDYQGKSVAIILHTATPPSFTWTDVAPSAIYVPDDAVATYQAASGFSTHSSKIKGLSELPSGWDSTTSN